MSEEEMAGRTKRGSVHRSPSYPAISLKTAIDRARTFYQHEKRSAANVAVASKHWGYSFNSSGGKQTLAALIAYGLMKDEGSGERRQVHLTDLALRILLDDRPDSVEKAEALRRAAVSPKIHAELLGKWPERLPSDPNLRHYLLIDKKFNENSVDDFIRQLRATADYAEIFSAESPTGFDSEEVAEPSPTPESSEGSAVLETPTPHAPPTAATLQPAATPSFVGSGSEVRQDTFSLDEGQVVLQWPTNLSEDSYEDLKDWLGLQLRKIKRSVQSSE